MYHFLIYFIFYISLTLTVLCFSSTVICCFIVRVFHEHFDFTFLTWVYVSNFFYKPRSKTRVGQVLLFLDHDLVIHGFTLGLPWVSLIGSSSCNERNIVSLHHSFGYAKLRDPHRTEFVTTESNKDSTYRIQHRQSRHAFGFRFCVANKWISCIDAMQKSWARQLTRGPREPWKF